MSGWRVAIRQAAYETVKEALGDEVGLFNGYPDTGAIVDNAPFVIITVPADGVPEAGTLRGMVPVDVQLQFQAYSTDGEDGVDGLLGKVHGAVGADGTLGGAAQGLVYVSYEELDPEIEGETAVYAGAATYLARITA